MGKDIKALEEKYEPLVNDIELQIVKAKQHLNELLNERSKLFQEIISNGIG